MGGQSEDILCGTYERKQILAMESLSEQPQPGNPVPWHQKLRRERERRNWTQAKWQKESAAAADRTVRRWESGEKALNRFAYRKLIDLFRQTSPGPECGSRSWRAQQGRCPFRCPWPLFAARGFGEKHLLSADFMDAKRNWPRWNTGLWKITAGL